MATDIILDGEAWIDVQTHALALRGSDLILDDQSRRHPDGPKYRRALVHDAGDGLTINYDGDYPGGLTLLGVAQVVPKAAERDPGVLQQKPGALSPARLVVRGDVSYEEHGIGQDLRPTTTTVVVSERFAELERRIDELGARVTALGG